MPYSGALWTQLTRDPTGGVNGDSSMRNEFIEGGGGGGATGAL